MSETSCQRYRNFERTLFKLLPVRVIAREREIFPKKRLLSWSFGPLLELISCRCVRHCFVWVDFILFTCLESLFIYTPAKQLKQERVKGPYEEYTQYN